MTTPQDIREKVFETSVFKGYDMGAVDDYLDLLANELGAVQKENAALKTKMKVLVDKIEEHRTNESALNMAILSAQKLSVQIESDARARAATIISEAEAKASAALGGIDEKIATEEARLQALKISTAKMFDSARELCKRQLANIDTISIATRSAINAEGAVDDAMRIPQENNAAAPAADPALDNGSTQVFMFSKDN